MKLFNRKNRKATTVTTRENNPKPYHITLHFFGPDNQHTFRTFDYAHSDRCWEDWHKLLPFLKKHNILGEHWETGLDEASSIFSTDARYADVK